MKNKSSKNTVNTIIYVLVDVFILKSHQAEKVIKEKNDFIS